jgi:hypothetical protein
MSQHPRIPRPSWPHRFRQWIVASGQALVEYVLILVLVIMAIAVIIALTGPAVGNVFSNTVANLLNLTLTPEDPMTEGEFWDLVTAVASYTPDSFVLITNTPGPDGDADGDGIANNLDNCPAVANADQLNSDDPNPITGLPESPKLGDVCDPDSSSFNVDLDNDGFLDRTCTIPYDPNPVERAKCDNCIGVVNASQSDVNNNGIGDACEPSTPTRTNTPGPTPTPTDSTFSYPFNDDGNKNNFQNDFSSLLKGPWRGTFWNAGNAGCSTGDTFSMATTAEVPPTGFQSEEKIVFPRGGHPAWADVNGKGAPGLSSSDFCARYTQTFRIPAGTYTWRVRVADVGSNVSDGDRLRIHVGATTLYNDWNGVSDIFHKNTPALLAAQFTNSGISGNTPVVNGDYIEWQWTVATTDFYPVTIEYADNNSEARLEVYLLDGGLTDQGDCRWSNVTIDNNGAGTNITPPPGASAFWSDSPSGATYSNNTFCILRLRGVIDLAGANDPYVQWQDQASIAGPNDTFWFAVRPVGASEWFMRPMHQNTFESFTWTGREVSLSQFAGKYEKTGKVGFVRQDAPVQDFSNQQVEMAFIIETDSSNIRQGWYVSNFTVLERTYPVIPFPFFDDLETDDNWLNPSGTWGIVSSPTRSGSKAWDDSPSGTYALNRESTLQLNGRLDMTDPSLFQPEMTFWHRWDLASGTRIYVEASTDQGQNWQILRTGSADATDELYAGPNTNPSWIQERIPLDLAGQNFIGQRVMFRFRIVTGSNAATGWTIDDIGFAQRPNLATIFPNWCDDLNSSGSLSNWLLEGTWGLGLAPSASDSGTAAYSTPNTLTDSPAGTYAHGSNTSATLNRVIDLSGATKPIVEFWTRWDINTGEALHLEVFQDATGTWDPVWSFTHGSFPPFYSSTVTAGNSWNRQNAWQRVAVPLLPFVNAANTQKRIQLRWRLDARVNASTADGWYIDDLCIREDISSILSLPWEDTFESSASNNNWYRGDWGRVSAGVNARQGTFISQDYPALTEYANNSDSVMEMTGILNLTDPALVWPVLYYWQNNHIGTFDQFYAEVQIVNSAGVPQGDWQPMTAITASSTAVINNAWNRRQVDLNSFIGEYIRIRFRMQALNGTTAADNGNGVWIDEVRVVDRFLDESLISSLPLVEGGDNGAPRWIREGQWSLVNDSRNLGSATVLGPGQWAADYFTNPTGTSPGSFGTALASESVTDVNFNWGNSAPALVLDNNGGNADMFMARFRRTVTFTRDTVMNIQVNSDDGHELYIDSLERTPSGDQWVDCGSCVTTLNNYTFTAGSHDIEIRYYENSVGAYINVTFTLVSGGNEVTADPFGGGLWTARYAKFCNEAAYPATSWTGSQIVPTVNFSWNSGNLPSIVTANNTAGTVQGGVGGPDFTDNGLGYVTIPAERYHTITNGTNGSGDSWTPVTTPSGFFGASAMSLGPDGTSALGDTTGPELRYEVDFPATASNWRIWVRVWQPDSSGNSLRIGLNGTQLTPSGGMGNNNFNSWQWIDMGSNVNVTTANDQIINIWMREDGIILDQIFLTHTGVTPTDFAGCNTGDPGDFWAAQFTRTVAVSDATNVTFQINSNDGHRLLISPNSGTFNPIASAWNAGPQTTSTVYNFTPGTYQIRIEYFNRVLSDGASLNLNYIVEGLVFHSDASVGANTPDFYGASLMIENPIDLGGATSAGITWWDRFEIGAQDAIIVEINTSGGNDPAVGSPSTWTRLYERSGPLDSYDWRQRFIDLTPYVGQQVVIRFRLDARNNSDQRNGWFVDDIEISR